MKKVLTFLYGMALLLISAGLTNAATYSYGTGASYGCAEVGGQIVKGNNSVFSEVKDFDCSGTNPGGSVWEIDGYAAGRVYSDSLAATARISVNNQSPGLTNTAPAGWTFSAIGRSWRADTLYINNSGLQAGEAGTLEFDFQINGRSWGGLGDGSAGRVWIRGELNGAVWNGRTSPEHPGVWNSYDSEYGGSSFNKSNTVSIPYEIGDEILLDLNMLASVWIYNDSGILSGSGYAKFFNSAGVTDIRLLDSAGDPLTSFTISSESGEFALYEPAAVPIPSGIWLFGSGLLGLVSMIRIRKEA